MTMAQPAVVRLDDWLRSTFTECNTWLDERYFDAGVEYFDDPSLADAKRTLLAEGAAHAGAIDDLPDRADDRYELLGMVGFVLGACRRHEIDDDAALAPVWAVADRLGASLGVAPRYVFAHQAFATTARDGEYRTFTTLPDERSFVDLNALAVLGYADAAAAVRRIPALGVSHPLAAHLLDAARTALERVLEAQQRISDEVSVDRFFRNIRPYFKSHRVGDAEWRGVNAGDFSAVNELDVLLGMCAPDDPFYAAIVAEKQPYVPPEDQPRLREIGQLRSLRAGFERELATSRDARLRDNAIAYLAVCRAHAAATGYHHQALVKPFLERPAASAPADRRADLSASGPPLEEVIATLDRLRRLRSAGSRDNPVRGLLAEADGAAAG